MQLSQLRELCLDNIPDCFLKTYMHFDLPQLKVSFIHISHYDSRELFLLNILLLPERKKSCQKVNVFWIMYIFYEQLGNKYISISSTCRQSLGLWKGIQGQNDFNYILKCLVINKQKLEFQDRSNIHWRAKCDNISMVGKVIFPSLYLVIQCNYSLFNSSVPEMINDGPLWTVS